MDTTDTPPKNTSPADSGDALQDPNMDNLSTPDKNDVTPSTPRRKRRSVKHMTLAAVNSDVSMQLLGHEEEFLKAIEVGDVPTVRRTLTNDPEFNVNCTDMLGRTPLRLAVEGEHLEIVELLLDKTGPKNMYDALLLAISLDHDEIALTILKHPVYRKIETYYTLVNSDSFALIGEDSSLFAAETTPLILAAQRNRYEVVTVLLQRGQTISHPHSQDCECHHCKAMSLMDELRFAKSRLNAYKGLASECYISLYYDDPILASFEMRQTLKKAAVREKHYREEYESLMKGLRDFVVKLLDNVRGNEELFVLLREGTTGNSGNDDISKSSAVAMSRLKLALKYDEKGFVAHPSCQKLLTSVWYGRYAPKRHQLPALLRPIATLLLVFTLPFVSMFYCVFPLRHIKTFLEIPFIKFVGQSTSFIVFLALILLFSITETPASNIYKEVLAQFTLELVTKFNTSDQNSGFQFDKMAIRPTLPGVTQIALCIFIIGLIWQECKQLYSSGLTDHFASLFNVIDFVSLSLYVASFALRYLTYYKTWRACSYFMAIDDGLTRLYHEDPDAMYNFYWLIADRLYWSAWDPINICEGLFSVANVLSFSRLFYLLAANEQLGPLQVSLRRMITDIMYFFVIFSIVVIAFMVGLNNLYWYYDPNVRKIVEMGYDQTVVTNAESAFGTIELTFITVFWALFGMGEPQVVELGPDYAANAVTGRIGYWVFGGYNLVAVIVLLNMLIAMMSRSFELIQNDESIEWKFARAELYMDFMSDDSFLMVPMNLIPSTYSIFLMLKFCVMSILKSVTFCWTFLRRINKSLQPAEEDGNEVRMTQLNYRRNGITELELDNQKEDSEQKQNKPWPLNIRKEMWNRKNDYKAGKMQRKKVTYESVIKNILKRFIFNTQNVEQSQVEAELEELKQDLSSFRYEVMNALSTRDRALQESINVVNAKLDIANSLHLDQDFVDQQQAFDAAQSNKGKRLKTQQSVDLWEGSWNDVSKKQKHMSDNYAAGDFVEEIVVPQRAHNGFIIHHDDRQEIVDSSEEYSSQESIVSKLTENDSNSDDLVKNDSIKIYVSDYNDKRQMPLIPETEDDLTTNPICNSQPIDSGKYGADADSDAHANNDSAAMSVNVTNKNYTEADLQHLIDLMNEATEYEVQEKMKSYTQLIPKVPGQKKRRKEARPPNLQLKQSPGSTKV